MKHVVPKLAPGLVVGAACVVTLMTLHPHKNDFAEARHVAMPLMSSYCQGEGRKNGTEFLVDPQVEILTTADDFNHPRNSRIANRLAFICKEKNGKPSAQVIHVVAVKI